MNGDLQQLYEYIGKNHSEQMAAIGELSKEFSEHKGATNTRLDAFDTDKKWDRVNSIVHYALVAVLLPAHAILRHFGLDV